MLSKWLNEFIFGFVSLEKLSVFIFKLVYQIPTRNPLSVKEPCPKNALYCVLHATEGSPTEYFYFPLRPEKEKTDNIRPYIRVEVPGWPPYSVNYVGFSWPV